MTDFSQRLTQKEWMDDLAIEQDELHRALCELDVINRWLGGYAPSLQGIFSLLPPKCGRFSLLDVGCGGGELLTYVQRKSTGQGIGCAADGVDIHPGCIEYAQRYAEQCKNIHVHQDTWSNALAGRQYDVIHAGLFLHHLTDEEIHSTLKQFVANCRYGVVINDLHRHPLAYYSIRLLSRLFSRSPMIKHDAPLSVRRAFTKNEMMQLVKSLGANYKLRWRWAFRWLLLIKKD